TNTHILNLTSLEFLIIKNLEEKGIHVKDLANKANIKLELIEKGIKQLQNRGYVIIQDEKVEIIDNLLHLFKSDFLKVNYQWKTGYSN
ncbi:MAG: hypothetical protein K8R79_12370, partial [Calditrichales bacterium]|nr:hypothetical protein [Calditrichales bacterium]